MAPLKNIVWVGTGRIGLPILERVLATGKFNIKLLVRNQVSAYTLPSGLASAHQVDCKDHKALVQHLKGQDAVIVFTSFVPGNELDVKNIRLVDAAIEAGVKYFLPSEWAPDTAGAMDSAPDRHGPTLPTDMALAPKRATHNYLLSRAAEGKIQFAGVFTGVLPEVNFSIGFFAFDFDKHTATLPDNGLNPWPATSFSTLSKVVIALFTTPTLISNRFYHISDGVFSHHDVFKVVEKTTGVPWTRSAFSIAEAREGALQNMAKGVYGPMEFFNSLQTGFFGGIQVWRHVDNELFGVKFGEVDLRDEVADIVRRHVAGLGIKGTGPTYKR
ncbi:isoflavone reductase family protein [Paraphoma chrysanthemicola]|uniref:Isoflavone reductase family protein n=1 Tax=Paraphoma chrysanthemicola TaxID=798071 RepID=A0A8K0RE68_9PLEO|nr:isoflavone reductase family protein [Paraphoma chrysanthemicola]